MRLLAFILIFVSFSGFVQSAPGIVVVKEKLNFAVPAQLFAEYVVAHTRLSQIYRERKDFFEEKLDYRSIYVAAVNDRHKMQYVFVGIPNKEVGKGGFSAMYQLCKYSGQYQLVENGVTIDKIALLFDEVVAAEGGIVPFAGFDLCKEGINQKGP